MMIPENCTEYISAPSLLGSSAYQAALRVGFSNYDEDRDDHLNYNEFSKYFQESEGECLSIDVFKQLGMVVHTNDKGAVSFKGFLQLYKSVYDEQGTSAGDANLEKDLKVFGTTPPPPPPPPPLTPPSAAQIASTVENTNSDELKENVPSEDSNASLSLNDGKQLDVKSSDKTISSNKVDETKEKDKVNEFPPKKNYLETNGSDLTTRGIEANTNLNAMNVQEASVHNDEKQLLLPIKNNAPLVNTTDSAITTTVGRTRRATRTSLKETPQSKAALGPNPDKFQTVQPTVVSNRVDAAQPTVVSDQKPRNDKIKQNKDNFMQDVLLVESEVSSTSVVLDLCSPIQVRSSKSSNSPTDTKTTGSELQSSTVHPFFASKRVIAAPTASKAPVENNSQATSAQISGKETRKTRGRKPSSKARKQKSNAIKINKKVETVERVSDVSSPEELVNEVEGKLPAPLFGITKRNSTKNKVCEVLDIVTPLKSVKVSSSNQESPDVCFLGNVKSKSRTLSGKEGKVNPLFMMRSSSARSMGSQRTNNVMPSAEDLQYHKHEVGMYLPNDSSAWNTSAFPNFPSVPKISHQTSIQPEMLSKLQYSVHMFDAEVESARSEQYPTNNDVIVPKLPRENSASVIEIVLDTPDCLSLARGTPEQVDQYLSLESVANCTKSWSTEAKNMLKWFVSRRMRGHLVSDATGNFKSSNCPSLQSKANEGHIHGALPWEQQWTDKYRPERSNQVCGNKNQVTELKRWLLEWKTQISQRAVRPQKAVNEVESDSDDDFLPDQDVSRDMDEFAAKFNMLSRAKILEGPCGSGKTAAVFACATELGYEVIELNASSLRSGVQVRCTLGDGSQNKGISLDTRKRDATNMETEVSTTETDHSKAKKQKGPAPKCTAPGRRKSSRTKSSARASTRQSHSRTETQVATRTRLTMTTSTRQNGVISTASQNSTKPTTTDTESAETSSGVTLKPKLILIEEAEIQFDADRGFEAAIQNLIFSTCCPIILCCNNAPNAFTGNAFPIIHQQFTRPNVSELAELVTTIALAEGVAISPESAIAFVHSFSCDIRAAILNLQFWIEKCPQQQQQESSNEQGSSESQNLFRNEVCETQFSKHCHPLLTETEHLVVQEHLELLHDFGSLSSGGGIVSGNVSHEINLSQSSEKSQSPNEAALCPLTTHTQVFSSIIPLWYNYLRALASDSPDPTNNVLSELQDTLKLSSVVPSFGRLSGGSRIHVYGSGFEQTLNLAKKQYGKEVSLCVVVGGEICLNTELLSDTKISAITPPCGKLFRLSHHSYLSGETGWNRQPHTAATTKSSKIARSRMWPTTVEVRVRKGIKWCWLPQGDIQMLFEYCKVPEFGNSLGVLAGSTRPAKRKSSPNKLIRCKAKQVRRGRKPKQGKRQNEKGTSFQEFESAFTETHGKVVEVELQECIEACISIVEKMHEDSEQIVAIVDDMVENVVVRGIAESGRVTQVPPPTATCASVLYGVGSQNGNIGQELELLEKACSIADSISFMDMLESSTGVWEDIYPAGGSITSAQLPKAPFASARNSHLASATSIGVVRSIPHLTSSLERFLSRHLIKQEIAVDVESDIEVSSVVRFPILHGRSRELEVSVHSTERELVSKAILRQVVPLITLGPTVSSGIYPASYCTEVVPLFHKMRAFEKQQIAIASAQQLSSRRRKLRFVSQLPAVELDSESWLKFDNSFSWST